MSPMPIVLILEESAPLSLQSYLHPNMHTGMSVALLGIPHHMNSKTHNHT